MRQDLKNSSYYLQARTAPSDLFQVLADMCAKPLRYLRRTQKRRVAEDGNDLVERYLETPLIGDMTIYPVNIGVSHEKRHDRGWDVPQRRKVDARKAKRDLQAGPHSHGGTKQHASSAQLGGLFQEGQPHADSTRRTRRRERIRHAAQEIGVHAPAVVVNDESQAIVRALFAQFDENVRRSRVHAVFGDIQDMLR